MIIDVEKCPNLAAALARAQAEIEAAHTDSENPHFKSKFASAAAVRGVMRGPFAKNGLSVTQAPCTYFDNDMLFAGVISTLRHESGEAERSKLGLPVGDKVTPQACGSAITYARRYALAGIAGVVVDDDDDAHEVSKQPAQKSPRQSQQSGAIDRARDDALADAHKAFHEYNAVHKRTGKPAVWDAVVADFMTLDGRNVETSERDVNWYSHFASWLRKAAAELDRVTGEKAQGRIAGVDLAPCEGPDAPKPNGRKAART